MYELFNTHFYLDIKWTVKYLPTLWWLHSSVVEPAPWASWSPCQLFIGGAQCVTPPKNSCKETTKQHGSIQAQIFFPRTGWTGLIIQKNAQRTKLILTSSPEYTTAEFQASNAVIQASYWWALHSEICCRLEEPSHNWHKLICPAESLTATWLNSNTYIKK